MASPLAGPATRTLPAATAATLPIHANERYSPASAVACASHSHANVTGSLSFIQVPKNLLSASGPQPTRPEVIHRSLRLQQSRSSSSKTKVIPSSSEWTSDHAEPPRIATVSVRRHSALQDIKQSERPLIGRSAYDGEELAPVAHFGFADGTAFRREGVRQRGSPQRTHRPRPRRSAWLIPLAGALRSWRRDSGTGCCRHTDCCVPASEQSDGSDHANTFASVSRMA